MILASLPGQRLSLEEKEDEERRSRRRRRGGVGGGGTREELGVLKEWDHGEKEVLDSLKEKEEEEKREEAFHETPFELIRRWSRDSSYVPS